MNYQLAIFDLDGTLVNSLIMWDAYWSYLGERYLGDKSFRPSTADDKTIRTTTMKQAMTLIHENYGIAESPEALIEVANEYTINFYKTTVKCKDGMKEFLDHLKANGVKMCVASASSVEFIKTATESCGIADYFDGIFSCADIGKGKDKPDIYLKVLDHFGVKPEDACIFEDSLVAISTAKQVGTKTVAIYDKYNYGQAEMKAIADEYIADGETVMRLVR